MCGGQTSSGRRCAVSGSRTAVLVAEVAQAGGQGASGAREGQQGLAWEGLRSSRNPRPDRCGWRGESEVEDGLPMLGSRAVARNSGVGPLICDL